MKILACLFLLLAAPAAALEDDFRAAMQLLADAKTAPAFTLKDSKGNDVSLAQFKGKTVLLDFWATWCGPCRASTPFMVELHDAYAAKGLVILAINAGGEDAAAVEEYGKKNKIPYRLLIDDAKTSAAYGVKGIPAFIIVGKDGKIAWRQSGYDNRLKPAFKQAVEAALAAP